MAAECRLVASMSLDFFARGLHTRTAVARLLLRQLGFLVIVCNVVSTVSELYTLVTRVPEWPECRRNENSLCIL